MLMRTGVYINLKKKKKGKKNIEEKSQFYSKNEFNTRYIRNIFERGRNK